LTGETYTADLLAVWTTRHYYCPCLCIVVMVFLKLRNILWNPGCRSTPARPSADRSAETSAHAWGGSSHRSTRE